MHSKSTGVTLIELMIAMSIFGLLIAMALPSYGRWIQSTQVRTAAESIQNGLQLARAEAVRRNTAVSFTLTGNNWTVAVVNPAATIQSRSGTEGSPNAVITAPAAANPYSVTFSSLGRATTGTATISVTNPTGGACESAAGPMRCLNVVVRAAGQVRMCDPMLGSGNPQSC